MIRDIKTILYAREAPDGWFKARNPLGRIKAHRFHMTGAGAFTSGLGASSKIMPEKDLLDYLLSAGQKEAKRWLETSKKDVGRRSTVDLRETFFADLVASAQDPYSRMLFSSLKASVVQIALLVSIRLGDPLH